MPSLSKTAQPAAFSGSGLTDDHQIYEIETNGTYDEVDKGCQRKILSQAKDWKTEEYFVYVLFFKLHGWAKDSLLSR